MLANNRFSSFSPLRMTRPPIPCISSCQARHWRRPLAVGQAYVWASTGGARRCQWGHLDFKPQFTAGATRGANGLQAIAGLEYQYPIPHFLFCADRIYMGFNVDQNSAPNPLTRPHPFLLFSALSFVNGACSEESDLMTGPSGPELPWTPSIGRLPGGCSRRSIEIVRHNCSTGAVHDTSSVLPRSRARYASLTCANLPAPGWDGSITLNFLS